MEFERALVLLSKTKNAEVPVLASVYGQPEPRRFVLMKTFAEGSVTTLHLKSFPSTLSCPPSSLLSPYEMYLFDHPSSAPATSPIHDPRRTVRVFHRARGRLLYFSHETRIDSAVRRLIKNNSRSIRQLKNAGIQIYNL